MHEAKRQKYAKFNVLKACLHCYEPANAQILEGYIYSTVET